MVRIKIILYICCLISTIKLSATGVFTFKQYSSSYKEKISIGKVFTSDEKISPFLNSKQIIGFAISGTLTKKSDDYYARVILCDKNGYEHLVLELYEEINNKKTFSLSDYCEETMILNRIQPVGIKIMLRGAEMKIDHVTCLLPKEGYSKKEEDYQKEWISRKKNQVEQIIQQINAYNYENKRLWGADVTEISILPWSEKKKVLGIADDCINGRGFEYYAHGIFEFERKQESNILYQPLRNSLFPPSFDWRNRHGRNWMTSVKNQTSGSGCWAFASVGVTEAIANLYYNQDLSLDLSEQEVISCSNCGSNAYGGTSADALQWIADYGISEESAFPFVNSDVPCSNKNNTYEELMRFNDAIEIPTNQNKEDSVKKYLIQKGPLLTGYTGHAMPLVGYNTIQAGDTIRIYGETLFYIISQNDSRIGQTYWIYKNSYGTESYFGHAGYAYIYFNTLDNMLKPYYAEVPVYSNVLTDQDIVCEDADGDGYYYWGIGQKPANCPYWVPDTPDGDDSNINLGSMDEYGHLDTLPTGITIKTSVTYSSNSSTSYRLGIVNGGSLTITGTTTLTGNSKIRVCEGGVLVIDGGTLQNANITMVPGSQLIVRNNGIINLASGKTFEVPEGVVVNIESGEIN